MDWLVFSAFWCQNQGPVTPMCCWQCLKLVIEKKWSWYCNCIGKYLNIFQDKMLRVFPAFRYPWNSFSALFDLVGKHTLILEYFNIKEYACTFQFCIPVFLDIHRHPKQKEIFKCYDAFLRAALTGHGHPSPFWKIAKMALFNPCM